MGQQEKTQRLYQLAAERFSDEAGVFVQWSESLQKNDPEKAQSIVLRGLKLHPKNPMLQFARGRHLVRKEQISQALPLLLSAFDSAPRTHKKEYGYVYAITIHQAGDWAEAIAILRLLKKEYPEDKDVEKALDIFETKRSKKG